jgi:hypothetical protein
MPKAKIKEWTSRYGLAVIISFIVSVAGANLSKSLFSNAVATAFLATWSGTIAFYATIAAKDFKQRKIYGAKESLKLIRNMIIEFGPAEYFDGLLIRPFMLYLFPLMIDNLSLSILAGNAAADMVYFVPVIFSYEARKKLLENR